MPAKRRALKLLVALAWAAASSRAHAQEPPAQDPVPQPAPDKPRLSMRIPPRIEYLPELELPEGVTAEGAELEAVVRVEIDGRASLEESTATGELRAAIEAVLAGARFVPARLDDEPVTSRVRLRFEVRGRTEEPKEEIAQAPKQRNPSASGVSLSVGLSA